MNRPWLLAVIGLLLVSFFLPHRYNASDAAAATVRLMEPGRVTDAPKTRFYLQARDVEETEVIALRDRLISGGAEKVNLFVPSMIIVCEVPETVDIRALVTDGRVAVLEEALVASGAGGVAAGVEDLGFVKSCYEMCEKRIAEPDAVAEPVGPPAGFAGMARFVSPEVVAESKALVKAGLSAGAGAVVERNIMQNSEFLVGNILVQLVFPESEGHTEDWTDRMIADATSGAYQAALDFQSKFAYAPINLTFRLERRVPTAYEPIGTTLDEHGLWIKETMYRLKIPLYESADLMVHHFNNIWRKYYRADWVFTAFIANSDNDEDHRFADQIYTSYGMIGGPYLVIPYPADDPYGSGSVVMFSMLFQHEMAHVFWALDEDESQYNRYKCDSYTGYLDYVNENKVDPDKPPGGVACHGPAKPCIMWQPQGFFDRPVCEHTQGHIGAIDEDGNSVPDVVDAAPIVQFEGADVETVLFSDVTVNVRVFSAAVPNQNPYQEPEDRISYTPGLRDMKVSIGGFGSVFVDPVDGKWDEEEEDVSVQISGIPSGLTQVGAVVRNVFGRASGVTLKSFYYLGITYTLFAAVPDNDGTRNAIQLSWKTMGDTFGATFDLHRIDMSTGVPDTTCIAVDVEGNLDPTGVFRSFSCVDTNVTAGCSYLYFVNGCFDIERDGVKTHYEVASDAFEARGAYPIHAGQITSQAVPNPLRDRTWISVRVPETLEDASGESASGIFQLVRTPLSITVFDVAGRVVKRIYNGYLYGGVKNFEWDGTNEHNERVRSGVYFVRTEAGPGTDVKKVVVVR